MPYCISLRLSVSGFRLLFFVAPYWSAFDRFGPFLSLYFCPECSFSVSYLVFLFLSFLGIYYMDIWLILFPFYLFSEWSFTL